MMLEAVWFKNGEEVYKVSPVMNIVCDDEMTGVEDIEINDGHKWHEFIDFKDDADDFVIRVKRD